MHDHLSALLERGLTQLAGALARHAGKLQLIGLAALGPPARFGTRTEIELLLVADPLLDRRHRPSWLAMAGGLRLRLRWKSLASFLYPSPLYLQVLQHGAILYDPAGLLEESFRTLVEYLAGWELPRRRGHRPSVWRGSGSWPDETVTPARPFPASAGREGRVLAL